MNLKGESSRFCEVARLFSTCPVNKVHVIYGFDIDAINMSVTVFLSYFFVKKYLLVGASGMLWAVQ